jgi:hypothetical protein
MRDVFPYVVAIDVDRYSNTILVGSQLPLSADALIQNVGRRPETSPLRVVAGWSLASGNIRAMPAATMPAGSVFTDDRAPVERVIDQMIFDAARELTSP